MTYKVQTSTPKTEHLSKKMLKQCREKGGGNFSFTYIYLFSLKTYQTNSIIAVILGQEMVAVWTPSGAGAAQQVQNLT